MSTATVRVVRTPNPQLKAHKKEFSRVYVTFNSPARPNSVNTLFNSGDVSNEDLPRVIQQALHNLRASRFVLVS